MWTAFCSGRSATHRNENLIHIKAHDVIFDASTIVLDENPDENDDFWER